MGSSHYFVRFNDNSADIITMFLKKYDFDENSSIIGI